MTEHGYITEIPQGNGGDVPSLEGIESLCDRCSKSFIVKADPHSLECNYHWGKIHSVKVPGEKEKKKVFSCCSQEMESLGCSQGPHVFYEKDPELLHARFPFSRLAESDGKVDVVALDCEMIYTTGGMRLAHVSIVDGGGNPILNEPVRLEENVEVM
jgi:RNA exonuclease 1